MVHIIFDVNSPNFEDFFNNQYGSGRYFSGFNFQRGRGQRGQGAGKILNSIWRFLQPNLKAAGKEIGKEGVNMGIRALTSISQGALPKEALLKEAKSGAKHLLRRAADKYSPQTGSGKRKKRKRSLIGRRFTKKTKFDALGPI